MSVIGSNILAGASGQGGYFIDRSLRFRASASAYLNRTPASAGNRKTWTWSGWVKLGNLGTRRTLWSARDGTAGHAIEINDSNIIDIFKTGAGELFTLESTPVYRDVSAWYHFVFSVDTTQATASNRFKIYVNGSRVTSFSTETYPSQNSDLEWNNTIEHDIGRRSDNVFYFDGYITEVNFIDGQALDPTDFGEYNDDTGVWQAKKYTGTYGTNGFYLNFSDNTSTTTLGEDGSGNGNDWTTNNISLTSGSTYDSMTDVPTLTSETQGNYTVGNPLMKRAGLSITGTNANLSWSGSAGAGIFGTMKTPATGKWYFEVTPTAIGSGVYVGLDDGTQQAAGSYTNSVVYLSNGNKNVGGTGSAYGATFTTGDVVGAAVDCDAGTITFYKNNTSQGAITTTVTNKFPFVVLDTSATANLNFGQRPFAYTPPTGFKALNTYNLPDSTVENGSDYFNTVLYTGTGSTQSITGVGFQPDFLWFKNRSVSSSHRLVDGVRGLSSVLFSNDTAAESTDSNGVTAVGADGFTVGTSSGFNNSPNAYVAWNWKANGSGVSNTDGSITSTVSANTTAGFSIVTYTGTGSAATVGHGLGVAPKMVIVKQRSGAGGAWIVWHGAFGTASNTDYIVLNGTGAKGYAGTLNMWNATVPTSSVFSIGTYVNVNSSTQTYVAYCFAEVEGFSKMGSYTGNGSPTGDGPFVYTGFRPAFVMVKRSDSTGSWQIKDTERNTSNLADLTLFPNLPNSEYNLFYFYDLLSNGFKVRGTDAELNASGGTYIYIAFAENPFKNSLAR